MKRLLISLMLLGTLGISSTSTKAADPLACGAAALAWLIVAPTVSFLVNTTPFFFPLGEILLGNDLASRYALGGIMGGTAGTLVATVVYNKIKTKPTENENTISKKLQSQQK